MICQHIDAINAMITELDRRIDAEIAPYRRQVDLLDTVDGVDTRGAEVIIVELDVDMHRFTTTAAYLASLARNLPR